MRIRATAAMGAVLLCAASLASAQPPGQAGAPSGVEVTVYGAGTASCGKWLADRQTPPLHNNELSWVLGFLTASGSLFEELHLRLRQTDADAVAAWVDKYCRENPLKDIGDASANLVIELAKPQ